MSASADQVVIDGGTGSCHSCGSGTQGRGSARRAHVAVQQLVPRLGERVGELVGFSWKRFAIGRVDRVQLQREVRRQHHRRVPLRRVVRVGHGVLGLGVLRAPLLRAGGLVVSS
jgi:hypothetical protein